MLSDFVEILDIFKGLFKVEDAKGNIKYQAIFAGCQNELSPFHHKDHHKENGEIEKNIL